MRRAALAGGDVRQVGAPNANANLAEPEHAGPASRLAGVQVVHVVCVSRVNVSIHGLDNYPVWVNATHSVLDLAVDEADFWLSDFWVRVVNWVYTVGGHPCQWPASMQKVISCLVRSCGMFTAELVGYAFMNRSLSGEPER